MQESFKKYWKSIRKEHLEDSQIRQLVDQIVQSVGDDDPAWVSHVKQALTNKGVAKDDIERILTQLKDEFLDRAQRWGEKSIKK